jgi:hypothetical protein
MVSLGLAATAAAAAAADIDIATDTAGETSSSTSTSTSIGSMGSDRDRKQAGAVVGLFVDDDVKEHTAVRLAMILALEQAANGGEGRAGGGAAASSVSGLGVTTATALHCGSHGDGGVSVGCQGPGSEQKPQKGRLVAPRLYLHHVCFDRGV